MVRRKAHLSALLLTFICLLSTVLAACGGSSSSAPKNSPLIVDTGPTGDFTLNFNPFSSSALAATAGSIYEPLQFTNVFTGAVSPWLATSSKMSQDSRSITYTLNSAAKWTDGKPLTSSDVAFTFNLMHKYSGLDTNGVWAYLKSVTAPDAQTVVFTFNQPDSTQNFYIATKTFIVPEHIWSSISDPVKFANPNPVGSGPFKFKSFSSQNVTVVKNTAYWQPGKPVVSEVQFPASNDNAGIELRLYSNKVDWTGIPANNVQKLFVDRDSTHHHYWFQPVDFTMFQMNLTKAPFNQLAVRQAISAALDRTKMSAVAEQGYEPVAHPTGIIPSQQAKNLNSAYADSAFKLDTAKTASLLESAGFTKGSDGMYVGKDGKKLGFQIDVPSGFGDWVALVQIAVQNLRSAGINASTNSIGLGDYQSRQSTGQFDATIVGAAQGPSPFYAYNALLNSANTAPIGQAATTNYSRWKDATTDTLLKQYSTTTDPAVQKQAMDGLQKIMVEQLPVIPLLYDVTWSEYNTTKYTGWPDPKNPYASPGNYFNPDLAYVLLHLKAA